MLGLVTAFRVGRLVADENGNCQIPLPAALGVRGGGECQVLEQGSRHPGDKSPNSEGGDESPQSKGLDRGLLGLVTAFRVGRLVAAENRTSLYKSKSRLSPLSRPRSFHSMNSSMSPSMTAGTLELVHPVRWSFTNW